MTQTKLSKFEIAAQPVKSFFVEMLTRDIELEDAILDLLDNCVDGIWRNKSPSGTRPYKGYKAEIEIRPNFFSISDNCGGIPRTNLDYAFMMGPSDGKKNVKRAGTVGVYGIGMKRAIFKLGKSAHVITRNNKKQYDIDISRDWIENEKFENLKVIQSDTTETEGTKIIVTDLNEEINKQFTEGIEEFTSKLASKISTNFAYIIEKGFEVKINPDIIPPKTTNLKFFTQINDDISIRPYVFETSIDGVDVFLTVGLTRSFLSTTEIAKEERMVDSSLQDAGWTVICNDRVVLEQNRDKLTGWGEDGVPAYHNQFRIIAGIVEFKSDDPSKLPTTTTKRGINADHPLYREIKTKMCEGTKIFTDFTNDWKKSGEVIDKQIDETPRLTLNEIKCVVHTSKILKPVTETAVPGAEYFPILPSQKKPDSTKQRIAFYREADEISAVAEFLKLKKWKPATVGEKCFERVYKETLP